MPRIKLVRDRCNAVKEGQCVRAQTESEYMMALLLKMHEEIEEIAKDPSDAAEYADLMEVMQAFADANGVSSNDIITALSQKRHDLGGFEDGQIWTEVTV